VGAISIAEIIATPSLNLRSLIIHWNQIRGVGSAKIARAIKRN
jgi:hypothetical protein